MTREVSHLCRLNDKALEALDRFLEVTSLLGEKLGTIFLQIHHNFGPKNRDRVVRFVEYWPKNSTIYWRKTILPIFWWTRLAGGTLCICD